MTMSCRSTRSQLPDYVRAALPENEAAVVREHLQRCPRCRRRCDMEEELMSRMATQFDVPPPAPDFVDPQPANRVATRTGCCQDTQSNYSLHII